MPQYELNFRDYLRIIRKRKFNIVTVTLAVFILVVFFNNRQTPVYQTSCLVRFEQRRSAISALLDEMYFSQSNPIDTEINVIQSRPVAEEAAKRLGFINDSTTKDEYENAISEIQSSVSAEGINNTNLIRITITSSKPEWAAKVANKVAEVYVEESLKNKSKEAANMRQYIQKQLSSVEKNLKDSETALKELKEKAPVTGAAVPLENKLADLRSELTSLLTRATPKHPQAIRLKDQIQQLEAQRVVFPDTELDFARLTRDIQINEKLYMMLREKFEEVRISEAEKTSDVSVVDPAGEPSLPIRPNKRLGIMLGIFIGLISGFVSGFIIESLDTSLGTIEDVEGLLKVPVLGVIPSIRSEDEITKQKIPWYKKLPFFPKAVTPKNQDTYLIVQFHPKSAVAESYRVLRTNLKVEEKTRKVFLVTSAGPQEGKTTVSVNLGLTFCQMGAKTVIIDTDLRRPSLARIFGISQEPGVNEIISGSVGPKEAVKGLSDILLGKRFKFDEAIKTVGLDNLSIITSGRLYPNPSELLETKEMSKMLDNLRENFDIVILDSPPALSITDAAILAPKADNVLLVYEIGRTSREALLRTKIQLESVGAKVLGVVLNHTSSETEFQTSYYPYYASYKYKYYYSDKANEKKEVDTESIT